MNNLSAFLKTNKIKKENKKIAVSRNFINENGEPMLWEIKAISNAQDEAIRESCTKQITTKKGVPRPEFDYNSYCAKVAIICTIFPNLNDAGLQDSYGVMGGEELIKEMLAPGEYIEYIKEIQTLNGYDIGMEELVEEAKN